MKKLKNNHQPQNVLLITFEKMTAMNKTFQCSVQLLLIAMNRTFEAIFATPAHVLLIGVTRNVMFCSSAHPYIYGEHEQDLCLEFLKGL